MEKFNLKNIKIVLCNTTHSGNIGTAARAMKTMDLNNLVLVSPEAVIDDFCYALATNARDVVEQASIVSTLDEALSDVTLSYALTSRKREFNHSLSTPYQATPEILSAIQDKQKVALVFGCERAGLTIEQLEKCNRLITIPGNPNYFSLNLAQAVQIVAYEIYHQANGSIEYLKTKIKRATFDDNQGILHHIDLLLSNGEYYQNKNKKLVMRRLQYILNKANLDQQEVKLIRGMLASATKIKH
ncbi:MAG: RNA methyltransferase [Burkholderiales bacterium]|nr:RNA methyltransferase [Burkholderiales bacterium]